MKVVIDTSVFVSYLIRPRSSGAWLLTLWRQGRFEVVTSPALLKELAEVLERPHLKSRINVDNRVALLRNLHQKASLTPGVLDAAGAMPDPGDDILASAALEINADYIITRDKPLLKQGSCGSVQIITPNDFLSIVVKL